MSSLLLHFGTNACRIDDGSVRRDARDVHLDATIDVPREAILELFTFNGDARHAAEIAAHEIEKQGYFDGAAECIIHRVHIVGDSFQIICTILPLSRSATTLPGTSSPTALEECHLGFGAFSSFCDEDTDVILQIDLKIYVLRLRRGLYSLTVLPAQHQVDPSALCELLVSGVVDKQAPRSYCFSLWADTEHFADQRSEDFGNLEFPPHEVFSAYVCEDGAQFRVLSRSDLAAQLAVHLARSPLPMRQNKPLHWLLLQLKRKNRFLHVAEWFGVAALAALILQNILGITTELKRSSLLSEHVESLNLQIRPGTEPQIDSTLYAAQVRFIEAITGKTTVASHELLSLISDVRQIVSGVVPVKEVELVRPKDAQAISKAAGSTTSASPNKSQEFAVRVEAAMPAGYESRMRVMRLLLEMSEQRGLKVFEQPLAKGKDQADIETGGETLSLIFSTRKE